MSRSIMILFIILLSTVTFNNYVYADNNIEIHIKQNMDVKIKLQITGGGTAGGEGEAEGRFVSTLDGRIDGKYLVGKITLECQGISMKGVSDSSSTSSSISPISVTYSYIPTTPISNPEQACAVYVQDFKIDLKDLDEWFTNTYGKVLGSSGGMYQNIMEGLDNSEMKITYGGLMEYKGLPVFKFDIDFSGGFTVYGYHVDVSGRGTIYIYTGLYYTLYYDLNIRETADMGTYGKLDVSMELRIETIDHNLPSNSVHVHYEQDDFIIIAGGYPNAKIHLKGKQGDNKIIAYNEGTEPGYVSITYKTKTYKLESPTLNRVTENYVLMPGENITINLKVPLSKDIDVYTEAGLPSTSLVMLIMLSIIIVIVVTAVFIIYWMRKKMKAEAPPTVPSPPAPETPPPPSPPSPQQPSPTSSV